MAKQVLALGDLGQDLVDKFNGNFDELYLRLKEWTQGKSYELGTINYDGDGNVTTASVVWPDGSAGTLTMANWNATHETWDGYNITHVDSSSVVTQPAVTRNSEGAVTVKPALVIT